jgi:hypothetical protein
MTASVNHGRCRRPRSAKRMSRARLEAQEERPSDDEALYTGYTGQRRAAVAAMASYVEDLASNERHSLPQLDSEVARPRNR